MSVLGRLSAAAALSLSFIAGAFADSFDDVMALVPTEVTAALVVPSIERVSGDIDACLATMDRKETALAGRPVDHLRAALGIREGLNERGSMAVWTLPGGPPERPTAVLLIPADDPAAFIKTNVEPGADGIARFRGEPVFVRALAKHVLASNAKEAIDAYAAGDGLGKKLESTLGARALEMARKADVVGWSLGGEHLALPTPGIEAPKGLTEGAAETLFAIDVDPLGLSIRAIGKIAPGSALASLAASCTPTDGDGAATLRGLHGGAFLLAAAVDLKALGGPAKLAELAALAGTKDAIPEWLTSASDGVSAVRFACYPSKLGVLAGGILNDSNLVIESANPAAVRNLLKESILAQTGSHDGVRAEATWEDERTLKDGAVVSAFEVKETPMGPGDAGEEGPGAAAMRGMIRQVLFGPRGFHGFTKVAGKVVLMTFSQRPDVVARAVEALTGGGSLSDDPAIRAMRPWLVPGAQVEVFVSVGQFMKVVRQLAESFGNAGDLPRIPTKTPPVAISLKATPTEYEGAVMIPTAVLGAIYDQALGAAMGRRKAHAAEEQPSSPEIPPADATDAAKDK